MQRLSLILVKFFLLPSQLLGRLKIVETDLQLIPYMMSVVLLDGAYHVKANGTLPKGWQLKSSKKSFVTS